MPVDGVPRVTVVMPGAAAGPVHGLGPSPAQHQWLLPQGRAKANRARPLRALALVGMPALPRPQRPGPEP